MDRFWVMLMRQMCDILGVAKQSRCKDPEVVGSGSDQCGREGVEGELERGERKA